jgi:hypothetical protein
MRNRHRNPGTKPATGLAIAAVLAIILAFSGQAHAVLFRVGPTALPSPPANGYPLWYQDTKGLALDYCLPANPFQLDNGVCLILPTAQDPATGIDLPIVFPANYPDEAFFWNTTGVLDLNADDRATLVMALEGAFATGPVVVGDQVTFGRLRIVIDAPVKGNYTITHPYGTKIFPNVSAGKRAITFTSDIGIGAPGDFTGALNSDIGPFLVAADAPGGNPLPYVTVGGEQFLTDTQTTVFIAGSPTGNNFFRVCTDNGLGLDGQGTTCMTLDQFTVMGKVHAGPLGSPLAVDRATYARGGGSAHVDVFASATPAPNAAAPALALGDGIDNTVMPPRTMNGPTALGEFYGQGNPTSARAIPASVLVTNTADIPPFSVTQSVVDEVTITQATYNPATGTLTIRATSSDKGDATAPAIAPPQLFAIGLPGSATGSDALVPTGGADVAEQSLVYPIPAPLPPGGAVPPPFVTVTSTAGGHDDESVVVGVDNAAFLSASPALQAPRGTVVLFAAVASTPAGGPYEYQFWARKAGTATWVRTQGYGASATWSWNTAGLASLGNYEIQVYARKVGSLAAFDVASPVMTYKITDPNAATAVTLGASGTTVTRGTNVLFTAAASGGPGPYEYQFWARKAGTATWVRAQGYGTLATWNWATGGLVSTGAYEFQVYARRQGSTAAFEAVSTPVLTVTVQ